MSNYFDKLKYDLAQVQFDYAILATNLSSLHATLTKCQVLLFIIYYFLD